jgi:hypothetical protein
MKVLKYKYNPDKKGVFRVSVVAKPAVGEGDLVLMSAQEIKGVFYAPVMIPDVKIPRVNDDGEKYLVYYDKETVEQLANNYFKQCGNRNTNLEHESGNVEGVYPVESWIVKDPENDKSKALGMPLQKEGTWVMGYKADNPEVLEKVKNNLLQGLSIEGLLDMEEDTDNPITKFNKQTSMSLKKLMDGFEAFKTVLMTAEEEAKSEEKTAEEIAAEEEKKPAEMDTDDVVIIPEGEAAELATLKAEIEEKDKKIADLEAELATYKNDATLMSSQLGEVQKAFESYKAVKMSSQKLTDLPNPKVTKTYAEMSNAEKTRYNRNK